MSKVIAFSVRVSEEKYAEFEAWRKKKLTEMEEAFTLLDPPAAFTYKFRPTRAGEIVTVMFEKTGRPEEFDLTNYDDWL